MKPRPAGCLVLSLLFLAVILLGYYVLSYTLASMVAAQLPAPVQPLALAWIQGTPQAVGHPVDSDLLPGDPGQRFGSGSYYWAPTGYAGPVSFRCALPVALGTMTSPYGDTQDRTHPHTGVDYGTHQQSVAVFAPMGGQVTHAGWNTWLGWTVVIENEGWQVILGHHCCGTAGKTAEPTGSSSLTAVPGQIITAGTQVGLSGDTGNSFGIHLHLEVRHCDENGCTIQDPSAVLLPGQTTPCDWESLP